MSSEPIQLFNILPDPFNLIEIIGGIFAIIGGLYAAGAILLPWWQTWRDRRSLRKRLGAELYTPEDIIRATTYYIRPKCQDIDPAGSEEFRRVYAMQEDLFEAVDKFLTSPWENKYTILLADSGMGKTSFVLNYYAHYWRRRRKRKRFELAVVPLSIPNADDHIKKNSNPKDTVLLLDAFDEDTRAIKNHRGRRRWHRKFETSSPGRCSWHTSRCWCNRTKAFNMLFNCMRRWWRPGWSANDPL